MNVPRHFAKLLPLMLVLNPLQAKEFPKYVPPSIKDKDNVYLGVYKDHRNRDQRFKVTFSFWDGPMIEYIDSDCAGKLHSVDEKMPRGWVFEEAIIYNPHRCLDLRKVKIGMREDGSLTWQRFTSNGKVDTELVELVKTNETVFYELPFMVTKYTWGGFYNKNSVFKLKFTREGGVVNYLDDNCTSKLINVGRALTVGDKDTKTSFDEVFITDSESCNSGGKVRVNIIDGIGYLLWDYPTSSMDRYSKGSQLFRFNSDSEFTTIMSGSQKPKSNEKKETTNGDSAIAGTILGVAAIAAGISLLYGGDENSTSDGAPSYQEKPTESRYRCKLTCRTSGMVGARKDAGMVTIKSLPGSQYEKLTSYCENKFGSDWYEASHTCNQI